MVSVAQSESEVSTTSKQFDAGKMLLGVANGVIELETGVFREGRREDYITMQCGVSYDPTATCPEWIKFQNMIACGDEKLVAYKRRYFGLCLTGNVIEKLVIQHGEGANGKSSEGETISEVLGDYALAVPPAVLLGQDKANSASPYSAALKGKRYVTINETADSDHLNETQVKSLVSMDELSGRNLYEKPIHFMPTHKISLRTNHRPTIRGTDVYLETHSLYSLQLHDP
jgi:putative DNA primase/helicase